MNIKKMLFLAGAFLLMTPLAHAQLGTSTVNTNVKVTVAAEAALIIGTPDTNLTSAGTNFSPYTGSTSLTYFVRTTQSGGSGTINLKVTSDFAPTGGPSVTTPPTGGDTLAYICTVSSPGTPCSGSQTSSTASTTPVATFGPGAHSTFAGNSASVAWTLTNDPQYQTGSYQAVATFTIAAA